MGTTVCYIPHRVWYGKYLRLNAVLASEQTEHSEVVQLFLSLLTIQIVPIIGNGHQVELPGAP